MSKVSQLIGELKRRHVFRVAIAYGIVAWFILEIGSIVFPALLLPDWTLTLLVVLAVLGLPIAIVLAWAFDMTPAGVVRTASMDGGAEEPATEGPRPQVEPIGDGIVVLPFENLSSSAEDEYFSDGVTEDLIAQLYRIRSLRVISRSSAWQYKTARAGARQIAAELGVAYLLEGSVRRSGSRVRIAAQLIDAQSDRQMWAETYDRDLEDIFAIQMEVAERIASALQRKLSEVSRDPAPELAGAVPSETANSGEPLSGGSEAVMTSDLEAYDLYLRGRYLWNRRSRKELDESVSYLSAAIDRDPGFVRARSALAETYVTLAIYGFRAAHEVLPLARKEADEALSHDPAEAPALTAFACVRAIYHWEWTQAGAGFASAMKANPQYPTAPQWLAMNVLVPQGRFDEAVSQLERARELDPMCPSVRASFGVVDFMRGDYARALERFDLLVRQDPGFQLAHFFGGLSALYGGGDPKQAVRSLEKAAEVGGWSPEVTSALGIAFVAEGREAAAREILGRLRSKSEERYVSPVRVSQLHVALSEHELALDALEEAFRARATDLIWVDVLPGFEPVRDEPRYLEVRRKVFEGEPAEV